MARISRKELKSDKFAEDVGLTVDFFEHHRMDILRYGGAALGLAALIVGWVYFSNKRHTARQDAIFNASQALSAPVGAAAQPGVLSFSTAEAKNAEATKRLNEILTKYSGSDEALIAAYYLGSLQAEQKQYKEAEKNLSDVASKGDARYASLAKLALAQVFFAEGQAAQGEKTLRELIEKPTVFVTRDDATIALARGLAGSKPAEARKLLQPLLSKSGSIGQVASSLNSAIPE